MKIALILYRLCLSVVALFVIALISYYVFLYVKSGSFPNIDWIVFREYVRIRSIVISLFAFAIWAAFGMVILFTILSVLKKREFYRSETGWFLLIIII